MARYLLQLENFRARLQKDRDVKPSPRIEGLCGDLQDEVIMLQLYLLALRQVQGQRSQQPLGVV